MNTDELPEDLQSLERRLLAVEPRPMSAGRRAAVRDSLRCAEAPVAAGEWRLHLFFAAFAAATLLLVLGLNSAPQRGDWKPSQARFAKESAEEFKAMIRVAGLFYSRTNPEKDSFVILEMRRTGTQDIYRAGSRLDRWTITGISEKTLTLRDGEGRSFEASIESDATPRKGRESNPGRAAINIGLQKLGTDTLIAKMLSMSGAMPAGAEQEMMTDFLAILGPVLDVLNELNWDQFLKADGATIDLDALMSFLAEWRAGEMGDAGHLIDTVMGIFELYRGDEIAAAALLESAFAEHPDLRRFGTKVGKLAWDGLGDMLTIGSANPYLERDKTIEEVEGIHTSEINDDGYLTVFLNSTFRSLRPAPESHRHEDDATLLDTMYAAYTGEITPEENLDRFNHPAVWWVYVIQRWDALGARSAANEKEWKKLEDQLKLPKDRHPACANFAVLRAALQMLRGDVQEGLRTLDAIPANAAWREFCAEQAEMGVRHELQGGRSYMLNSACIVIPYIQDLRQAAAVAVDQVSSIAEAGQADAGARAMHSLARMAALLRNQREFLISNLVGCAVQQQCADGLAALGRRFARQDLLNASRRLRVDALEDLHIISFTLPYDSLGVIAYAEVLLTPEKYQEYWETCKKNGFNTGAMARGKSLLNTLLDGGPEAYPDMPGAQMPRYLEAKAAFERGEYETALDTAEAQFQELRNLWLFGLYQTIVREHLK